MRTPAIRLPRPSALLAAVLLPACASGGGGSDRSPGPGETPSVLWVGAARVEMHTEAGVGRRSYPVGGQQIWAVLPGIFEQLGIPVGVAEAGRRMGHTGFRARRVEGKRMSNWLDCGTTLGSGVIADNYDVTLQVFVTLTQVADAETEVLAVVDGMGRPRATSGNPVHCASRYSLEQRIAELIAERLAVGVSR